MFPGIPGNIFFPDMTDVFDCTENTCPQGNGPATPAAMPFDVTYAQKLSGDSIPYSTDSLSKRWWARRSLYKALVANDTILEQESMLNSFFVGYQNNSAVVKLEVLKQRVVDFLDGNSDETYSVLSSDIKAVSAGLSQEANIKDYVLYYLQYNEGVNPDNALIHIWEIATQCLFEGGPSVLEARAFLTIDSLELLNYAWEDSCDSEGGGSSKWSGTLNQEETKEQEEKSISLDYRLIPNLFNGNRTATILLGMKETGFVEIYNITGSLVKKYEINEGSNNMDLRELYGGVFIYKVIVNQEEKRKDKLVVLQ